MGSKVREDISKMYFELIWMLLVVLQIRPNHTYFHTEGVTLGQHEASTKLTQHYNKM